MSGPVDVLTIERARELRPDSYMNVRELIALLQTMRQDAIVVLDDENEPLDMSHGAMRVRADDSGLYPYANWGMRDGVNYTQGPSFPAVQIGRFTSGGGDDCLGRDDARKLLHGVPFT